MHAHQRDCVAGIIVNGYHRVPLGIIMIANGVVNWLERVMTSLLGLK